MFRVQLEEGTLDLNESMPITCESGSLDYIHETFEVGRAEIWGPLQDDPPCSGASEVCFGDLKKGTIIFMTRHHLGLDGDDFGRWLSHSIQEILALTSREARILDHQKRSIHFLE